MSDNQEFDFGQLDLENSEVDSGERRLRRGRYVTKVTAASLEKVGERGTGRAVKVTFVDLAGNGSITTYINVHLPGKQEATEIGKKQLKTLLTHGGHPNPNAPGDIKTIEGLAECSTLFC